jgi:hypothetical protein
MQIAQLLPLCENTPDMVVVEANPLYLVGGGTSLHYEQNWPPRWSFETARRALINGGYDIATRWRLAVRFLESRLLTTVFPIFSYRTEVLRAGNKFLRVLHGGQHLNEFFADSKRMQTDSIWRSGGMLLPDKEEYVLTFEKKLTQLEKWQERGDGGGNREAIGASATESLFVLCRALSDMGIVVVVVAPPLTSELRTVLDEQYCYDDTVRGLQNRLSKVPRVFFVDIRSDDFSPPLDFRSDFRDLHHMRSGACRRFSILLGSKMREIVGGKSTVQ